MSRSSFVFCVIWLVSEKPYVIDVKKTFIDKMGVEKALTRSRKGFSYDKV